jgi:hypothetical protein
MLSPEELVLFLVEVAMEIGWEETWKEKVNEFFKMEHKKLKWLLRMQGKE